MIRSLSTAVSGLTQSQQDLDVIGNNIANVNTTGFKAARIDFADSFNETLQGAGAAGSMQIGSGVETAAIHNQYTQGALTRTDKSTDLAVSGNGFFVVKDAVSGNTFATRSGEFQLDSQGYLINNEGLRVQGFSDAALTTRGDVQIDTTGAPATAAPGASIDRFAIDQNGVIKVHLDDGTDFVRGQVLMQNFSDPSALIKQGNNLLTGFSQAGALPQVEAASTNGLGTITAGALEMSNVDLASEFASLITAQRSFQANARMITTSDEILQELVNLKR
jgi:flagellar hook protein FlgE